MSKQSKTCNMVAKNKNPCLLSCSTPEHRADSPSRDSDSLCGSDAASPVPFICTQDGTEGETDVVWNFYTPKSERTAKSNQKDTTPLSRKSKRSLRPKLIEKHLPKRRAIKTTQKNTQLFQDLIELNKNLHELITKKPYNSTEKQNSGSEDDIFHASPEYSPVTKRRLSSNCLRRNVLSSNVNKQDTENAIESDDSMNECLFKASQIVEDIILKKEVKSPKTLNTKSNIKKDLNTPLNFKTNYDSMDSIMCNVKLESPVICKIKNSSVCLNDDSFDNLVGNLNDSALEQLTQMPVKTNITGLATESCAKYLSANGSPLSKSFGRHNSMPVSPSFIDINNKPSSSGMVFGRYSSMPQGNDSFNRTASGDSPIRCTPDEIKKKHQQAREKLLAKRLLPFTSTQDSQVISPPQSNQHKMNDFQEKTHTITSEVKNDNLKRKAKFEVKTSKNCTNLKELLEKKRQEALMKLRRRQQQNFVP